jgi:hypothetical protein
LGILSLLIGNSLSIKGTMQLFIVFNFSYKAKTVRGNMDQGSKWHFACAWGSVLKKLIAQFSSFQVRPPPLKLFLREAYKVSANELMIHVLICIY